jgi:3-deoxy-7-phosphoheptulonate synthase
MTNTSETSQPPPLYSLQYRTSRTVVDLGNGLCIGGDEIVIIAGPCAVESYEQTLKTAKHVKKSGVRILRGGAFKPRSSPYSFQGLGEEGLRILARVREETGLRVITEAMDCVEIDNVARYADIIQIGSRNMQNFSLLRAAGRAGKPVLLKRGASATLSEFLNAAEYILSNGNPHVILCERGIRTFDNHSRNTLDLGIIPVLRETTHLPVVIDPSHGTGRRSSVTPLARAAVAAGADGLIVEVHHKPKDALCDGDQSLAPKDFRALVEQCGTIAGALGKKLA